MENQRDKKSDKKPMPLKDRLVYRQSDLQELLGLSRNAIERLILEHGFSPPIQLGPRSKGWLASEVNEWLEKRKAERKDRARPERPCA
jgi:prophage regulatory protein